MKVVIETFQPVHSLNKIQCCSNVHLGTEICLDLAAVWYTLVQSLYVFQEGEREGVDCIYKCLCKLIKYFNLFQLSQGERKMCTTNLLLALFFLYGQTVVFSQNPTPNSLQQNVIDTTEVIV